MIHRKNLAPGQRTIWPS